MILLYLEERYPERPLYPDDVASRAEMQLFVDWFNRVWKVPPDAIEAELGQKTPDETRIAELGTRMADALDLFEKLLDGRGHLLGEDFSAADCVAFPFLKYAALPLRGRRRRPVPQDFRDYQPLGDTHPAARCLDRPRRPAPSA